MFTNQRRPQEKQRTEYRGDKNFCERRTKNICELGEANGTCKWSNSTEGVYEKYICSECNLPVYNQINRCIIKDGKENTAAQLSQEYKYTIPEPPVYFNRSSSTRKNSSQVQPPVYFNRSSSTTRKSSPQGQHESLFHGCGLLNPRIPDDENNRSTNNIH